ncbi:BTB/POZ domain protein [Gregarina niphandrodes]|uniref:BTB/POZ domain protein n=1 Tax=Gregarina niphandrodes TaxID=110365 RepID=A0A023B2U9_GRENI|nr:BTB/POZ domain protein [Gregarina niphandrodes]EZG55167.1 BTB/POZ domain protein [Gregarina niphandrodes]|eukprot:XP_011131755.1 BTB/POZ domain protein [Gregarina niphandrodes]
MPTKKTSPSELIRPKWAHLEYVWQLENFWELRALACVEALEDENGSLLWSQSFGDNEKGLWQLKLYPYGDLSPAGRGHVSLFLSLDQSSLSKAYAVFGCYLLDEDGNKIANSGRSFTRQKFADGSSSWGWSQFVKVEGQSLDKLLSSADSLVVKCEIEVFTGVLSSPPRSVPPGESWEAEMKAMLCDPRHYNVTLLAQGRELRAHKEILKARSKWFATKLGAAGPVVAATASQKSTVAPTTPAQDFSYTSFGAMDLSKSPEKETNFAPEKNNTQESCQNVIVIENMRPDIVENIIQYTHTDECKFLEPGTDLIDVIDLFTAAKDLNIPSLYKATFRKLSTLVITKPNAIAIQEVAKRFGDKDLEQHCASYLLMCVRDLSKDEIIKTLTSPSSNKRGTTT